MQARDNGGLEGNHYALISREWNPLTFSALNVRSKVKGKEKIRLLPTFLT